METEPGLFQCREVVADDLPMVREWWAVHGGGDFPAVLLPPVGVVVEQGGQAVAACWLYMAVGVGVCWPEYPVSRPGLSMGTARAAFAALLAALEAIARAHDYGVMVAHTLPPLARVMRQSLGFMAERRQKVTVMKFLRKEEAEHGDRS
jgi:hypothetical protein